jgi:hypothetical protein
MMTFFEKMEDAEAGMDAKFEYIKFFFLFQDI